MAARRTARTVKPLRGETPATAPVEPPLQNSQTAPDLEAPVPTVNDTGVAMIRTAVHPIVDAATGEPPVLEGLFVQLVPHSTIRVCRRRLLENEEGGVTKLLLCAGAQVSIDQAQAILERLAADQDVDLVDEEPEPVVVLGEDGEPVAVIDES